MFANNMRVKNYCQSKCPECETRPNCLLCARVLRKYSATLLQVEGEVYADCILKAIIFYSQGRLISRYGGSSSGSLIRGVVTKLSTSEFEFSVSWNRL
jgi:hypothetical protein